MLADLGHRLLRPEVKAVKIHPALSSVYPDHPGYRTDLSYVLGGRLLSPDRLTSTVRAFGVERVLFGSDFPYFDPEDSLDYLGSTGLSASVLELVMGGNADRIFAV